MVKTIRLNRSKERKKDKVILNLLKDNVRYTIFQVENAYKTIKKHSNECFFIIEFPQPVELLQVYALFPCQKNV